MSKKPLSISIPKILRRTVVGVLALLIVSQSFWVIPVARAIVEDYTGYTVIDPNTYLTITPNQITASGDSDVGSYAYRDLGVGWLSGSFQHEFGFTHTDVAGRGKWYPWVAANSINDARSLKNIGDGYSFELKNKNGSIQCKLINLYTDSKNSCSVNLLPNTPYYATVIRANGNLTLTIYSDVARTLPVSTVSVAASATEIPQYIYAINNENKGSTGRAYAGTVSDLELFTFEQSGYRWFTNTDSTSIGAPLATPDTPATLSTPGEVFRLRMLLHIGGSPLPMNLENFKLQYAERSGTCDTGFIGETYSDITATSLIAFTDNPTPLDGDGLTSSTLDPTHAADLTVDQSYEELNNFTNSLAPIGFGQDGLWDFALKDNGGTLNTGYCLRAVRADGTLLDTYTAIPELTMPAATTSGTIMSDDFDFDSLAGGTSWGEVVWSTTEPQGNVLLRIYYSVLNDCDTPVPDTALANNTVGFDASQSPLNISGLDPLIYNQLCLEATLTAGINTSPTLDSWSITAITTTTTILAVDIVDDLGTSVVSPSITLSSLVFDYNNQNSTGILGIPIEKIRLSNQTFSPAWSVSVAATGGSGTLWSDGSSQTMDYNDPLGAGQLSIDPSTATVARVDGGSIAGISLGSPTAFAAGVVDNITLFSSSTAATYQIYDFIGASLSQTIPAQQPAGTYTLNLTLTAV